VAEHETGRVQARHDLAAERSADKVRWPALGGVRKHGEGELQRARCPAAPVERHTALIVEMVQRLEVGAADDVDLEQFRMGLAVELEHGSQDPATDVTHDDEFITGKIALAHLREISDYYTRLAAMERDAER